MSIYTVYLKNLSGITVFLRSHFSGHLPCLRLKDAVKYGAISTQNQRHRNETGLL